MKGKDLFPYSRKIIFMQGGTAARSENRCIKFWRHCTPRGKRIRPGKSPDLYPIENPWAILMKSIYDDHTATNLQQIIAKFQKKLKFIPFTILEDLPQSFKKRVHTMMEGGDRVIRY